MDPTLEAATSSPPADPSATFLGIDHGWPLLAAIGIALVLALLVLWALRGPIHISGASG